MVYIFGILGDAQARPKFTNTKQYNGKFGCLHFLQEGVQIGNKRVYRGTDFDRRTVEMYLDQLETAKQDKELFMGIKGPSWLTDYIYIPLQVFLDYMHLCLEGGLKTILNLWFLS